MLRMTQIEYIKDLYENERLSLSEIARRTGKDFRTVQKYAYRDNWNPPVKPKTNPEEFPVLGAYIPTINEWLENDEREPRKQRHTISLIHKRLQKEQGYEGSYASVKRYVNRKRAEMAKHKESFLPLAHPPGSCQVDFGDVKYYDGSGNAREGHELVVSFPNSNTGWVQLFPAENQECLLTGLQRIFYHIGGVPTRCRFDNLTAAVVQILEGKERKLSDGFIRFMLHHRFKADFCNPDSGNEKGHVENKVGYKRRNMFVPVPVIEDLDAYNAELLKRCDEDFNREHYKHKNLICELWEDEKHHLLTLPEYEYEVFKYDSLSVNTQGFIKLDTNKYGLSPEMRGTVVQAKIYFDKIEVYYDHSLLKTFVRSYEKNGEYCDWREYIPSLIRKPGATEHTRFFNQIPKLWQEYLKSVAGKERKSALMLLSDIVSDGNEDMCDGVIEMAAMYGMPDNDSIRQCYILMSKPGDYPPPLELTVNPPLLNYHPDLSAYDGLAGGVVQ